MTNASEAAILFNALNCSTSTADNTEHIVFQLLAMSSDCYGNLTLANPFVSSHEQYGNISRISVINGSINWTDCICVLTQSQNLGTTASKIFSLQAQIILCIFYALIFVIGTIGNVGVMGILGAKQKVTTLFFLSPA